MVLHVLNCHENNDNNGPFLSSENRLKPFKKKCNFFDLRVKYNPDIFLIGFIRFTQMFTKRF